MMVQAVDVRPVQDRSGGLGSEEGTGWVVSWTGGRCWVG